MIKRMFGFLSDVLFSYITKKRSRMLYYPDKAYGFFA